MKQLTGVLVAALIVVLAACGGYPTGIQGTVDRGPELADSVILQDRPERPQAAVGR